MAFSMKNNLLASQKYLLWMCLLSLLTFLPLAANAQNEHWNYYLLPESVSMLTIDSQGVRWAAELNKGVWSSDGNHVVFYNTANSGLCSDFITGIAVDQQNNKWFSTNNGISKFDGVRWTTYDISSIIPNSRNYFTCVAIDGFGHKWFGAWGDLLKFDGTTWTHYSPPGGINGISIHSMAIDRNNVLWLAGNGSTSKFDGTTWTDIPGIVGNSANTIVKIDPQGNKWYGSQFGIHRFNDTTITHYRPQNSGFPDIWGCSALEIDRQGNKWIGTGKGLTKFDGTTWTTYNRFNSGLPSDGVGAICFDAQGNKWIGGTQGGITKFDNLNWATYTLTNSQLRVNTQAIAIDSQGNKWFGTTKFNDTTWTNYNASNSSLKNINVTCTAVDRQGQRWFGLDTAGVSAFDGTQWRHYNAANSGLTAREIICIAVDPQNNKWFGTNDGLFKFDGTTWTNYNMANSGLLINRIVALDIDAQGNKWIVMDQRGIIKFDGTNWTTYTCNTCFDISSIKVDAQGNTWISSSSLWYGVSMFNGTSWTNYQLPLINAMQIDRAGNKWFGTNDGVYKFDGTTWTAYTHFRPPTRSQLVVIQQLAIDKKGDIWVSHSDGISKLSLNCFPALQISVEVFKGDSVKPMRFSTLANPTTLSTGGRGNMTRRGTFNSLGNALLNTVWSDTISIKRKSLAIEGLPELDGMDAFQMNLVVSDHPNATRSVSQLLAMDVNGDTKIDAADIAAVMQRSLNPQTGFKQANRLDTVAWRHFPKTYLAARPAYRLSATFPNNDGIGISRHKLPSIDSLFTIDTLYSNQCDTSQLKVVGILLGDADGNYFDIGTNAKGALADTTLFFDGLRATKIGRDTFRVPVYANQRMFGFGLKIENYTNGIQILSISDAAEVSSSNRVDALTKRCFLSAYSTNGNGIAANTPLCYVTVKTNCPFPSQFGTMTAYLNGTKVNTQVTWNGCTPTDEMVENTSVNVYPNPTDQQLTIDYSASVQTLSIVNLIGQTLKVLEINASGHLQVDVSELPKGVYFLRANNHQMTKFVKL
jgi:ligand-binding sensor domain-containing protein